jgi:uncharacterized Rossmann fold enzyme
MSKIEQLKKLTPHQRAESLKKQFNKNKRFFAQKYPAVADLLKDASIYPYHITATDDFLTITNQETGELCHPQAGLDKFSEMLGDWTNSAWIDIIEGRAQYHNYKDKYSEFCHDFQNQLLTRFPGVYQRMQAQVINLPAFSSNKRFSNPVVFLGVFHGLHIDYYLSRTQVRNAAFVEPDPVRFLVSCYFLDYQSMDERLGGLVLKIGARDYNFQSFFNKSSITSSIWTRVLPGYASNEFELFIDQLRLALRKNYDVWMPAEWLLKGMRQALDNIIAGDKLCVRGGGSLSEKSRIAVIGAGPSLSNDLEWLKQHQDQFIIFSVHSAVSALRSAGIKPDFQFTLDIHQFSQSHLDKLNLDPSVPVVTLVSDVPDKFSGFRDVLRVAAAGNIHPVKVNYKVPYLSPTSGNMALGFACWCRPAEIYLFGLDFGYRQATSTHVKESSVYDSEKAHRSIIGSGHLQVPANFDDGEGVYTQSYFNFSRIEAQKPITQIAKGVRVVNCSDGARIEGAVPRRAADIELHAYAKEADIEVIRAMFEPASEDIHWSALPLDGEEQLEAYKKAMLRVLKMKKFNWLKFAEKIDAFKFVVEKQLPGAISRHRDDRIDPYIDVAKQLLMCWYRMLCFTNNEHEWQRIYEQGYEEFSALVEQMTWDVDDSALGRAHEKNA